MINLIPNEEKKKKVRDFYFRLTIVFLTVMAFSIFIASAALLPSYFMSSVKVNLINSELEIQKSEPVSPPDQKTLATISNLKNKLTLIETIQQNKYLVSEQAIGKIILEKMPDIKITEIAYDNTSPKGKNISIEGTAENRERLLLFRKALEDDIAFKKVDLPISNFIKGSNIRFSLNLTPA